MEVSVKRMRKRRIGATLARREIVKRFMAVSVSETETCFWEEKAVEEHVL